IVAVGCTRRRGARAGIGWAYWLRIAERLRVLVAPPRNAGAVRGCRRKLCRVGSFDSIGLVQFSTDGGAEKPAGNAADECGNSAARSITEGGSNRRANNRADERPSLLLVHLGAAGCAERQRQGSSCECPSSRHSSRSRFATW